MASVWTRTVYPRDDGVAFDRVVFFSDAVFAIALTLAAVEIGLPEVEGDPDSVSSLWAALAAKGPVLIAFLVAFVWVAIYWRANHRFVMTLRAMDTRYVVGTLVFLALIALLPIPAGVLGEYWNNPLAIAVFAVYASAVSGMETVLFALALRGKLFVAQPDPAFSRVQVLGSLSPIVVFLTSIPLAFISPTLAVLWWPTGAVLAGFLLGRMPARPPEDPV
jgi:uncharacterized membrane protein